MFNYFNYVYVFELVIFILIIEVIQIREMSCEN